MANIVEILGRTIDLDDPGPDAFVCHDPPTIGIHLSKEEYDQMLQSGTGVMDVMHPVLDMPYHIVFSYSNFPLNNGRG